MALSIVKASVKVHLSSNLCESSQSVSQLARLQDSVRPANFRCYTFTFNLLHNQAEKSNQPTTPGIYSPPVFKLRDILLSLRSGTVL